MRTHFKLCAAGLGLLALQACASAYGHPHGYGAPAVPEGHMPPPGECRIWYPDLPPGHQPPPGPCHQLRYQVPPGAYLIWG
ncbi:MAG TPA: hypothetical protein VIS03_10585 [Kiloniellaceae bacterium]